MSSNRPQNNNTNFLMGDELGPSVYRLKAAGGKYVYMNPNTFAGLVNMNVGKLNNALQNKRSSTFEKMHGNYGMRTVKHPLTRANLLKNNIVKMAGPKNPVKVNMKYSKFKAWRDARAMKAEMAKRARKQEPPRSMRNRLKSAFSPRVRTPPSVRNTSRNNNNNRESSAWGRYTNTRSRMTHPPNANYTGPNIMNSVQRVPLVKSLSNKYTEYKNLGKQLRTTSTFNPLAKARIRKQMANARKNMESKVKALLGSNAGNINRLNNKAFKNKVYTTIRANGRPMGFNVYMNSMNRYAPSYY